MPSTGRGRNEASVLRRKRRNSRPAPCYAPATGVLTLLCAFAQIGSGWRVGNDIKSNVAATRDVRIAGGYMEGYIYAAYGTREPLGGGQICGYPPGVCPKCKNEPEK
jgi:hypothetical protein